MSKQDVYVNVIGGLNVYEPAADLGIALAIATCARDVIVDEKTAIIGEVGLSGEIRSVTGIERRIAEARALGFKRVIIPASNKLQEKFDNIEIIPVSNLLNAITASINPNVNIN